MGRRSRKRSGSSAPPAAPPAAPRKRKTAQERDAEARAALEPLGEGERPPAVTAGAIAAVLLAIGNVVAFAAGLKLRGGKSPNAGQIAAPAVIMLVAAWGMWRAKYWAVLGFQFILGLLLVTCALLLIRASSILGVIVVIAIAVPAGFLFWKLVKSLARIQMPERRPPG